MDLREQLDGEGFSVGTWSEPDVNTRAIAIEDVPVVVAAWLRDKAAEIEAAATDDLRTMDLWAADTLRELADALDAAPKGDTNGE